MPTFKEDQYEAVIVFDASLDDSAIEQEIEKAKNLLAEAGATKVEVNKDLLWGKRRLEYEIKKRREGFYVVLNFTTASTNNPMARLNRVMQISDNVLRHLIIHRDDVGKKPRLKKKTAAKKAAAPAAAPAASN